ncbi:hypothetical protein RB595_007133 [Gaeumannomyces hyphopodioides]
MDRPPFDVGDELCGKLEIKWGVIGRKKQEQATKGGGTDGQPAAQPVTPKKYLPGEPRVQLPSGADSTGADDGDVAKTLLDELITEDLDTLAPHLWLLAKQDSRHISSLTEQLTRGRQVVVTEDPGLHLVWIYDRVFVKPLPKYLLSHAFWQYYLLSEKSPVREDDRQRLLEAAHGFLRSYAYLIRHRSDFAIAANNEVPLLPKGISYARFVNFISKFEVLDGSVSPRYHYGELRLTRLNFWSKIFLRRSNYRKVHWQYGAYIARYYAPLAFLFGFFALFLGAMQVILAVQAIVESGESWLDFAVFSRGFAVFTIVLTAAITVFIFFSVLVLSLRELLFALRDLRKKRSSKAQQLA